MTDAYEQLARYYDLALEGFEDDLDLYVQLAERSAGLVLEMGAGTGRVALALAALGHQVIGLEPAGAMLGVAQEKCRRNTRGSVNLIRGDMRALPLGRQFGLLICARDTFLHLADTSEQLQALREARRVLAPAGVLVLDLPGPGGDLRDWEPGARAPVHAWTREHVGRRVSRHVSFTADLAEQAHDVTDVYDEVEPSGTVRRRIVQYRLRHVFPAELELMLQVCGLRLAGRYGGYDLAPFDDASERMIVFAEPARL